jgi:hypothetical protein
MKIYLLMLQVTVSLIFIVSVGCGTDSQVDKPPAATPTYDTWKHAQPAATGVAVPTASGFPTAAPAAVAAPGGGFVVDASDFLEEFSKNNVAATGKYKGQEVTVTGTVETIDLDMSNNPYIAVTGEGRFEGNSVWCMINDASQSAGLDRGDNVTVVGTFERWLLWSGILANCSVK